MTDKAMLNLYSYLLRLILEYKSLLMLTTYTGLSRLLNSEIILYFYSK